MDRFKRVVFTSIYLVVSFGFCLLILEAVLRALPVSERSNIIPTSVEDPYLKFERSRKFVYSKGPFFELHALVHVNSDGYVGLSSTDSKSDER